MISVIVPVYNGSKYLRHCAHSICNQTYKDIELIFVPNNCRDNSVELCNRIASRDNRVKVIECEEKGTSLARKCGVMNSKGEYILFFDQDDSYVSKDSIERMHEAIEETRSDIVQFNYYRGICNIPLKKHKVVVNFKSYTKEDLWNGEILTGAFAGGSRKGLNTSVWNKIYKGNLLRESEKNISEALYFSEDAYLNLYAFTCPQIKKVTCSPNAYYIWNKGTGFTASYNAGEQLLKDYNKLKPEIIRALINSPNSDVLLKSVHLESLYSYHAYIKSMIRSHICDADVLSKIKTVENYKYICIAKEFFNAHPDMMYEELRFLCSDYSEDQYLYYCKKAD